MSELKIRLALWIGLLGNGQAIASEPGVNPVRPGFHVTDARVADVVDAGGIADLRQQLLQHRWPGEREDYSMPSSADCRALQRQARAADYLVMLRLDITEQAYDRRSQHGIAQGSVL